MKKLTIKYKFEVFLLGLILLTSVAVLAEKEILFDSITITQDQAYTTYLFSDEDNGGATTTVMRDNPQGFEWECDIQANERVPYPYCGLEISLSQTRIAGIDLSNYSSMYVWLDYEGQGNTVRITFRNFNPEYSDAQNILTTKFNEIDIPVQQLTMGVQFNLRNFTVPTWWILENQISPHHASPEFTNVVLLNIQTGSNLQGGIHTFKLNKIVIEGQWLATEQWYFSILTVWFFVSIGYLSYRFKLLRAEIKYRAARERELLEINKLLDLRSKSLEQEVITDGLTGALNRKGIEEAISAGLAEWHEEQKPFSVILLDIDHFKQINDTHGHLVGDDVLTALTSLIQQNVREKDKFARWGGEEFLLLCRETCITDALKIAEILRLLIANTKLAGIDVTASFGVAQIAEDRTIEQMFKLADDGLYKAKRGGRNKIEMA